MDIKYVYRAFALFLKGDIRWGTLLYVIRTRPDAVCGRHGTYALTDLDCG